MWDKKCSCTLAPIGRAIMTEGSRSPPQPQIGSLVHSLTSARPPTGSEGPERSDRINAGSARQDGPAGSHAAGEQWFGPHPSPQAAERVVVRIAAGEPTMDVLPPPDWNGSTASIALAFHAPGASRLWVKQILDATLKLESEDAECRVIDRLSISIHVEEYFRLDDQGHAVDNHDLSIQGAMDQAFAGVHLGQIIGAPQFEDFCRWTLDVYATQTVGQKYAVRSTGGRGYVDARDYVLSESTIMSSLAPGRTLEFRQGGKREASTRPAVSRDPNRPEFMPDNRVPPHSYEYHTGGDDCPTCPPLDDVPSGVPTVFQVDYDFFQYYRGLSKSERKKLEEGLKKSFPGEWRKLRDFIDKKKEPVKTRDHSDNRHAIDSDIDDGQRGSQSKMDPGRAHGATELRLGSVMLLAVGDRLSPILGACVDCSREAALRVDRAM